MTDEFINILLVEDNFGDARLIKESLSETMHSYFSLVHVTRISEALDKMEESQFDVALLDLSLPDGNGLDTVLHFRKAAPAMPVVVLTGLQDDLFALSAVRHGAQDFLIKGQIDSRLLLRSIRYAIERNRLNIQRRRAEEAFHASQNYAQNIIKSSIDMIIASDLEGKITEFNQAAESTFGYKRQEIIGRPVLDLYADKQEGRFVHNTTRETGKYVGEITNIRVDGSTFTSFLSASLLKNTEGRACGLMGVSRDITQRKKTEQALKDSEANLRLSQKIGKVGSWEYNPATQQFYWSPETYHLFGKDPEKFTPSWKDFLNAIIRRDRHAVEQALNKCINTGALCNIDFKIKLPNGSEHILNVQAEFLSNSEADDKLIGTIQDITDRKFLEEQLRQSQKMEAIGQLAGGIAHDFNNILTVIQGHLGLILADTEISENKKDSIRQVASAAERASNLTRQLLAFGRRQIMRLQVLDLNRVVKNMSKLLGRLIGENITVNYDYCQTLPAILADSSMIEQIILNLAVNARDAMSKGGQLRISTSAEKVDSSRKQYCPEAREGFFVCLTVADTGAGIENHILEHLFEPFFTTKDAGKGTGLGLATVYGIVKQHHGWIEVSSRPGQGTEFRIFFPSCSTQKELTPESTPLLIKGGQETILAVEDESELRNLILSILNRFGYKVLIASSGEEAIDAWDSHDGYINLLLTDVVLQSGMSGRDLAEYLQDKSPDLKVIFASGYSDELIGKDITLQEGLNFLQKPFSPNSLAKAVRNCLDSPIIPVPKRNSNLKTENP